MEQLLAGLPRLHIELNASQVQQFQTYFEELADWNNRINLTSITEYKEVQIKHFLDSLTVCLALPSPVPDGYKIIDIGAGAGFPGIPLKIAFPQIDLVLLESTGKKTEFLKYLINALELKNVRALNMRAEQAARLPEYREQFDAAVARGVAAMASLVELTLPFLKTKGRLIAQKKGDVAMEILESRKAIAILGGRAPEIIHIDLPEFADQRVLVVVEKISNTPGQYPRRDGMPAKQPIA